MEAYLGRVDHHEESVPTREGDARVIVISPRPNKDSCPLYINIHGGGFVRGYEKQDTVFSAFLAHRLGCMVLDIDYKLAPEHPFPTGLNECYDVAKWAFDHAETLRIDRERVAIGGHSAGANFTAAISLMANQTKDFHTKLQILDYPFLDGVTDPADKIDEESLIPADRMRQFNALYTDKDEDSANPFCSPVCATPEMLTNLPPALIITAGKDCLRHEAEKYAKMLIDAGVEVRMRKFLNSDHAFVINCLAEYKDAQELIVESLAAAFRRTPK
jgi:acetyl esterase